MARYIYSLLLTTVPPESPYPAPCPHRIPTSPNRTDGGHAIPNSSLLIPYCWAYTFSAKERDPETGLSYFGSRYYSSDLSICLSVDPMSDKYPSFSPYTYCANNPVRCVDPNGEEIYVGDNYYYQNGSLYYKGTTDVYVCTSSKKWTRKILLVINVFQKWT